MATNAIVLSHNADIHSVTLGELKINKQGGKSIPVLYNSQSFQLRMPRMKIPPGIMQREDPNTGNVSYSLMCSLKGCDPYAKERSSDDECGPVYNFFLDLQELIVKAATDNSSKWFGKKRSEESVRDSFKSILNVSTDKVGGEYVPNGKYPPSLRLKVPVYDGRVAMDVVDSKAMPYHLTVDSLRSVFPKYVEANLVLTGSIYVIGQSFGLTWRVTFAQVFPPSRLTAASVFAPEEDTPSDEADLAGAELDQADLPRQTVQDIPVLASSGGAAPKGKRRPAV
jgi:hypothetical protein